VDGLNDLHSVNGAVDLGLLQGIMKVEVTEPRQEAAAAVAVAATGSKQTAVVEGYMSGPRTEI